MECGGQRLEKQQMVGNGGKLNSWTADATSLPGDSGKWRQALAVLATLANDGAVASHDVNLFIWQT